MEFPRNCRHSWSLTVKASGDGGAIHSLRRSSFVRSERIRFARLISIYFPFWPPSLFRIFSSSRPLSCDQSHTLCVTCTTTCVALKLLVRAGAKITQIATQANPIASHTTNTRPCICPYLIAMDRNPQFTICWPASTTTTQTPTPTPTRTTRTTTTTIIL